MTSNYLKTLLLIGGAYADIPLIRAAKALGYHVTTTSLNTESPGHRYADSYYPADYSDGEAMLALAKRLEVQAVCAGCNDICALSAAYVAEKLGLPGHDTYATAQIIHHKDAYRKFAVEHGIITPAAQGFSGVEEALSYVRKQSLPLIIKPVDLGSGAGIARIDAKHEARPLLEKAFSLSKEKRVVIEKFISGSCHGFSSFLRDGKLVFSFFDNEHYFKNPYLVSAASTPSIVSEQVKQNLCAAAEKIAGILQLKDGIFHVQFILHEGNPYIIEICRRPPGDWYITFVQHATGVDYPAWIIKSAAGMDLSRLSQVETTGFFTRHCIMSAKHGTITDIVFDKTIESNVLEKFMLYAPGDRIDNRLIERLGIVFLEFDSLEEMLDKTERMQALIRVEVA